MDQYRIPLLNGRSLGLSSEQLRRIARGLGDQQGASPIGEPNSPIVEAFAALPPGQRADALAVVLRRFGDKQDLESISHDCGLNPWKVWQLEDSFLHALADARSRAPRG